MVSISISDLVGTVVLFMVYIALDPLMTKSLEIILPSLGPTESMIAKGIPLVILLAIFLNPIDGGPVEVRR